MFVLLFTRQHVFELEILIFGVFQGRITVTGLLDREKGDMYTLTVVADDGGPKKDSTVVRLNSQPSSSSSFTLYSSYCLFQCVVPVLL